MNVQPPTVCGCAFVGRRVPQQTPFDAVIITVYGITINNYYQLYNYIVHFVHFDYCVYTTLYARYSLLIFTFVFIAAASLRAPRQCKHPSSVLFHLECNRHKMCARPPRCDTRRRGRDIELYYCYFPPLMNFFLYTFLCCFCV